MEIIILDIRQECVRFLHSIMIIIFVLLPKVGMMMNDLHFIIIFIII